MANSLPIVSDLAFEQVDDDKSGELDPDELGVILRKVALQFGISPPSEDDIYAAMRELDQDSDGNIDKKELCKIINLVFNFMLQSEYDFEDKCPTLKNMVST